MIDVNGAQLGNIPTKVGCKLVKSVPPPPDWAVRNVAPQWTVQPATEASSFPSSKIFAAIAWLDVLVRVVQALVNFAQLAIEALLAGHIVCNVYLVLL
jgi:hypothetical protein